MNESTLYWILKLDDIRDILKLIAALGLVSGVVMSIASCVFFDDIETKTLWALGTLAVGLLVLGGCVRVAHAFVPSTRQMVIIKTLPAIVNNEELKAEGKEVYGLMKTWLKEQAK